MSDHLAGGAGGSGSSLWLSCYVLAGVALAVRLALDVYARAALVCELYPSFPFGETLVEELLAHATWLPGTRQQLPTLALLLLYALALAVARLQLLERSWLLLLGLVRELPNWLPFLASEPEVPELLSEDDGEDGSAVDDDDAMTAPLVADAGECSRALEKLVQEKLRFAGHRVERPDGWLVFDPLAAELVPQRKEPQPRRAELLEQQDAGTTRSSSDAAASARDKTTLEPHVLLRASN